MQPVPGGSGQVPQLPELVTNPSASLWPSDSIIEFEGREIVIPAQPAAVWLELLMGDIDLDAVFPGLAEEEDQDYVNEVLYSEKVGIDDVQMLALDLIELVAGRSWWVALRMINIAEQRWSILGGAMTIRGVDPGWLSLSGWLDVLWLVIFDHLPHDKWLMTASQIEAPPPGQMPENPLDTLEMSPDQFTSLMRG